ncbi:MAG TPA: phosphoribosyltransferase family protein [Anaerolineaceae bacterium]|nr:phosphoribosyltransferase family protein [Anaerolineaceae bacterium]
MNPRQELVSWEDVRRLIDNLLQQFDHKYNVLLMITRGGIVPGGFLAEAMDIHNIYTASVDFFDPLESPGKPKSPYLAWPKFLQFPDNATLNGERVLIVDDVWGSGRTITAVRKRVAAAGGLPSTCVLHFNPYRNLFDASKPDYFGATTDAHIIYPWEVEHGFRNPLLPNKP